MAHRRVLHSWKEIASYTGRGVRTIQRYEVQFGFPIHRPAGAPRSAVLAFSDEIDRWLSSSPTRLVSQPDGQTNQNGHSTDNAHSIDMDVLYAKARASVQQAESMRRRLEDTQLMLAKIFTSMQQAQEKSKRLATLFECPQWQRPMHDA